MVVFHRSFDVRRMRLLLFDLDGTLIDSRRDLANSVNAMLRHFGRPELPEDVVAGYVGDGASVLVRRALGPSQDDAFVSEALGYFLDVYREHKLDHTRPYDGVEEMLVAAQAQAELVVLSNKPVRLSRAIIEDLCLDRFFAAVYGGDSFPTKKPDPLGARTIVDERGMKAERVMIVGDSKNDVLTGRNAGIWTCGVTYGFAPQTLAEARPDVSVDTAAELASLFGG